LHPLQPRLHQLMNFWSLCCTFAIRVNMRWSITNWSPSILQQDLWCPSSFSFCFSIIHSGSRQVCKRLVTNHELRCWFKKGRNSNILGSISMRNMRSMSCWSNCSLVFLKSVCNCHEILFYLSFSTFIKCSSLFSGSEWQSLLIFVV
jgi:hypothetical protein